MKRTTIIKKHFKSSLLGAFLGVIILSIYFSINNTLTLNKVIKEEDFSIIKEKILNFYIIKDLKFKDLKKIEDKTIFLKNEKTSFSPSSQFNKDNKINEESKEKSNFDLKKSKDIIPQEKTKIKKEVFKKEKIIIYNIKEKVKVKSKDNNTDTKGEEKEEVKKRLNELIENNDFSRYIFTDSDINKIKTKENKKMVLYFKEKWGFDSKIFEDVFYSVIIYLNINNKRMFLNLNKLTNNNDLWEKQLKELFFLLHSVANLETGSFNYSHTIFSSTKALGTYQINGSTLGETILNTIQKYKKPYEIPSTMFVSPKNLYIPSVILMNKYRQKWNKINNKDWSWNYREKYIKSLITYTRRVTYSFNVYLKDKHRKFNNIIKEIHGEKWKSLTLSNFILNKYNNSIIQGFYALEVLNTKSYSCKILKNKKNDFKKCILKQYNSGHLKNNYSQNGIYFIKKHL